jgi:hypothetical protein
MTELNSLFKHRKLLLEQLAMAAGEIKRIDERLAVLKSIQLEEDLIQASECHV